MCSLVSSKQQTRGAKKWFPDLKFFQDYEGAVLYPDEVTAKWKPLPVYIEKPVIEKKIKNLTLNFGPQHPAAHGVLRLVLELEGEVR